MHASEQRTGRASGDFQGLSYLGEAPKQHTRSTTDMQELHARWHDCSSSPLTAGDHSYERGYSVLVVTGPLVVQIRGCMNNLETTNLC